MSFSKAKFGLFYSLPLDAQDWHNLALSRVTLVMLPMEFADNPTLSRLAGMGCRVILRAGEHTYYQDDAPMRITAHALMAQQVCPVHSVIIGNEPENALSLEYGANTWGEQFAYVHRRRFDAVRRALQARGIKVCSPAQTMRSISEDEQPVPGSVTWREICCLPQDGEFGYLSADYNGCHLYGYGWDGPVDELRAKFALKYYANIWHKSLIVDEVGIPGPSTQMEKMGYYIDIAEMLLSQRNGRQHPLGQRVEALIPFVSNGDPGNPPAWSPSFLIRDEAAYRLLGNWMGR